MGSFKAICLVEDAPEKLVKKQVKIEICRYMPAERRYSAVLRSGWHADINPIMEVFRGSKEQVKDFLLKSKQYGNFVKEA